MIEAILPDFVRVAEVIGEAPPAELEPVEAATVGRAVDSRLREFATGRACARRAMAELGLPVRGVARGDNREPVWPEDVVGSITHTKGYCGAALALKSAGVTLGIDCEPDGPLPRGVLERVSTEAERAQLASLPDGVNWGRLLFSAKESVYKALWPVVREWIGFSDAEIRFEPAGTPVAGRFRATVSSPLRVEVEGQYLAAEGFVMTSVVALGGSSSGVSPLVWRNK
jgi:4'-phosphopantetheinyl transferase EntD